MRECDQRSRVHDHEPKDWKGRKKSGRSWCISNNIKYLVITHTYLISKMKSDTSLPLRSSFGTRLIRPLCFSWIRTALKNTFNHWAFYLHLLKIPNILLFYLFILCQLGFFFLLLLWQFNSPPGVNKSYRSLSVSLQRDWGDNLVHKANNVSLHIQLSRSWLWSPSPLPNYTVIPGM